MSLEITDELIAGFPPEAQAVVRLLLGRIAELEAELAELRKTPRNSSLPPSAEHPHAKPPREKSKSPRKRGGQPGHPRAERALVPTEDCSDVVPLKPTSCRRCGEALRGDDPVPRRHQVWELPEIKPLVTEYQRHRLTCPGCGESTCGELPPGVPTGQSGPRLIAFVALLMAYYRQSKRRTAEFVTTVTGVPCSASLTVKHQAIATAALRPGYDEVAAALPTQKHLHGDESPTKQGPQKAWLWSFVADAFTVFALRTTRAATVLTELLGEDFGGTVTCDRAKMYWFGPRLQWCWAHLKRDFQALIDHADPQVKRLGHDLMRPTQELFRLWSNCRDGTLTRSEFERAMEPIRETIDGLLLRGWFSGNARLNGMCRELHQHREWLWTFVEVAGIEPTNNAAERSLRHAVIWRKLSFGTQSAGGSRFAETLLTTIETCRRQSRDVYAHVVVAVEAHFAHRTGPSLLPRA